MAKILNTRIVSSLVFDIINENWKKDDIQAFIELLKFINYKSNCKIFKERLE